MNFSVLSRGRGAVKFDKLRLDGFKSFADRSEIHIEPGLTGIVGPNGCGKSNLLEALKWALGETSAKRMRGAGMDDVIFGGTERRPPRNTSEVSLLLDNRHRTAPPEINDQDILEIVRRIERGQGTSYRVNGRPVRMRDVQLLFQDNASGASSSAIVSQGRVANLINAKASDRRSVLEEAAGVSGLAARRHDSDLKLKQTEQNLQRAEDSLGEVTTQANALRRQARQLIRFREIDGNIRAAQAIVLLIRLRHALDELARAQADHEGNEKKVEQAILDAQVATQARESAIQLLGPLREKRTAAETELARAVARLEGIENEAERRAKEQQDIQSRLLELSVDRDREDQAIDEAERTIVRLREEQIELAGKRTGEAEAMEIASAQVETARQVVEEADAIAHRLNTDLAGREASRAAAIRQRDEVQRRVAAVEARLNAAQQKLNQVIATVPDAQGMMVEAEKLAGLEASIEVAEQNVARFEGEAEALRAQLDALTSEVGEKQALLARSQAEAAGLDVSEVSEFAKRPVLSMLHIEAGYEPAVAAAFGQALEAGIDGSELQWWQTSGAKAPALPAGRRRLAEFAKGPAELQLALEAVAVLADADLDGALAWLPVGSVAVSQTGRFIRWDGFGGAPTSNSVEAGLKRAARLRELQEVVSSLEPEVERLRAGLSARQEGLVEKRRQEADGRIQLRTLNEQVRTTRDALSALQRRSEDSRRAVAVAESELSGIRAERQTILQDLRVANDALAEIPEDDKAKELLLEAKERLKLARESESQGRIALERLTNEQQTRRNRFDNIMRELADWTRKLNLSKERREDLSRRDAEANKALAELEQSQATPQEAVNEARVAAETARSTATDATQALDMGERAREGCEDRARSADSLLANLREDRARIIAGISQAQSNLANVHEAIAERLAVPPEALEGLAGVTASTTLPPLAQAENQFHRLEAEKVNFGPVNFLAESELAEHEKRLEEMEKGRIEIQQAIQKLRQAIKEIEDEARAKLEDTFSKIDRNFRELFQQLFAGGEAHLRLVGPDILEAGLEIYASPPGKRMQILSLLSGGEQTLTAMALIFAAFLSNPSPICVLDEADAALDDSNTDRLVSLVETMAQHDATRFLVITHSPLTMARMNRLYGVTMQERGVSSVTLVDLDRAVEIADS